MHLFYIDESGTGLRDNQSPYFVMVAMAVPDRKWQEVDSRVAAFKRRLVSWAKPEDFEIKGRDLQRGDGIFKRMKWEARLKAIDELSRLIAQLQCQFLAVQVDKRDLPEHIASQDDLYRVTFWRLLEEIEQLVHSTKRPGMVLVDQRSTLHSSTQDRRLLDAYHDWLASRSSYTNLIEAPWFGFSAFYAGLQLADFVAYMIDRISNDEKSGKRNEALRAPFKRYESQIHLVHIP